MGNKLIINFTGFKQIRLELVIDRPDVLKEVGVRPQRQTVDFSFDNNLDTVLIEAVDKLLKKNRITVLSLSEVKIAGDIDPNSSAFKIAQTWIEAVKTLKNKNN